MKRYIRNSVYTNIADQIIDIFDDIINKYGFTFDDVHLLSESDWKKVAQELGDTIHELDLELVGHREVTSYGFTLSGNSTGIVRDIHKFYMWKSEYSWQETDDYTLRASRYFKLNRHGYPDEITVNEFSKLANNDDSGWDSYGYGAYTTLVHTAVKIYRDYNGNFLIQTDTLAYD